MDFDDVVIKDVEQYTNVTREMFVDEIQVLRKPAVLKNVDIGECVAKWTKEYLIEKVGSIPVKIHVSPEGKMDFLKKNFMYKTILFKDLIERSLKTLQNEYFFHPKEFYYLRSLSNERRGKQVADIENEFPSIAGDINLPKFFDESKHFSSVFRIGSAGVQVWTHYDVMDNFLIQIHGRKRVSLFSPSDAPYMYLNGDKSEIIDIDKPDFQKYPKFKYATRYDCILEPGDVLFIPALWFHNTLALTFGIGVNVFWKNLDNELYDKNDYYGNKDVIPGAKMLQMITKAMKCLDELPEDYKDFYAKRAVLTIERMFNEKINNL